MIRHKENGTVFHRYVRVTCSLCMAGSIVVTVELHQMTGMILLPREKQHCSQHRETREKKAAMEGIALSLCSVILLSVCPSTLHAVTRKYFMEEDCGSVVEMTSLGLESVRVELTKFEEYHNNMDCILRIQAPQGRQLMLKLLALEVDCNGDYLRLYDGNELNSDIVPGTNEMICGKSDANPVYASTGSDVILAFRSNDVSPAHGFRILITAFRPDVSCLSGEFQCNYKDRCISNYLRCDGYDNCGDNSDECKLSPGAIAGIVLGCVAALAIILIIACCFRRRNIMRQKAREQSSENATRNSMPLTDEPSILKPDPEIPLSSQPLYAIPRYPLFVPIYPSHFAYATKSDLENKKKRMSFMELEHNGPMFMTAPSTFKNLDQSMKNNPILTPPPPYMLY